MLLSLVCVTFVTVSVILFDAAIQETFCAHYHVLAMIPGAEWERQKHKTK